MEWFAVALVFLVPLAFIVLVLWLVKWFIDTVFRAGEDLVTLNQRRKTTEHYYDREDVYLDYEQNQWYYKPGYPRMELADAQTNN